MLRALASAILFLTRIPLPTLKLDERDFARGAGFFAWVGVLIALPLYAASRLVPALGASLAAVITVALWVLITGGLHLDGLADSVDGLSGGRGDRARTLEIMRDSRIGSHGALALVLLIGLKWAALERAFAIAQPIWLMAPVAARFACTLLLVAFPYARTDGLGSPFVGLPRAPALITAAGALGVAVVLLGPLSLVPALIASLCAVGVALRMSSLLGGLTGDVYGAAIELAELAALLEAAALRP
ncbi:MAG TPA: adenosylcobinamide-GDP ribazoletransferase [Polyangiales bacterium]|nr:adenosylcobinamide-GDP ribazoletransferase [Polyangiales bacterium]